MEISVVIPFYYGNAYIENLIKMLNRNYLALQEDIAMEVLFVNDSPEEAIDFGSTSPLFKHRIINNIKNLGIHETRVRGLEQTEGEYILFLDQDDMIADDYLYRQSKNVCGYDFSICSGNFLLEDGSKKPIFVNRTHQMFCLDLDFHYACSNPIVSPGQVLIKKDVIPVEWKSTYLKNNGADDHLLWLLLLENNRNGVINDECLYTHISTGSNTSLNVDGMCASNLELIGFLEGKVNSKKLKQLRRQTLYYASHPEKVFTKIKFWDVGLRRKRYERIINKGNKK